MRSRLNGPTGDRQAGGSAKHARVKPLIYISLWVVVGLLSGCNSASSNGDSEVDVVALERPRVLEAAERYLGEQPVTVTAHPAERSAGGLHDFYSEGDYWWPDPDDPDAPYVRRDGLTNPDNFVAHRKSMRRLSLLVPALTAAYVLTDDVRYAEHARHHLNAWFVDPETRMNPNLLYGQAISGRVTGRGIGIIDTIHLVEVAQSVRILRDRGFLSQSAALPIIGWFANYLDWMRTHPYGIEERDHGNNHSTAWALQVAVFARLVDDDDALNEARNLFVEDLLPEQMDVDGSFPDELARTKPYGYSLFHIDILGMLAEVASDQDGDLWTFELSDGRGLRRGLEFITPYVDDRDAWPYGRDVMHHDDWPVRHPTLLFGGLALNEPAYIRLWSRLDPDPTAEEVLRNFPIRQPLLWLKDSHQVFNP